jgi:hypothetical protein
MPTTLSAIPAFSNPPATPIQGWSNSFVNIQNDQGVPLYAQASYLTNIQPDGALPINFSKRQKDVVNKLKVSQSQNVYDADFEYGPQPLRWENLVTGNASIQQDPKLGSVVMKINQLGDVAIRQSRPYHRYQPGKSMYMATAMNFGTATAGQFQRVGIFDDGNGIFFEQGSPVITGTTPAQYIAQGVTGTNPYGMYFVVRSDIGGIPTDIKVDISQWSDPAGIKYNLDWRKIQMIWMEYAWYGAGALRWGVLVDGEEYILHEVGSGNNYSTAWARTGNLPARYEQRDTGTGTPNTMQHYGVSILIEGGRDLQRGFTYSYGTSGITAVPGSTRRQPILSVRNRTMGSRVVDTYTVNAGLSAITSVTNPAGGAFVQGQPVVLNFAPNTFSPNYPLSGLQIYFPTLSSNVNGYPNGTTGRIYQSTTSSLTCVDVAVGLSAYPLPSQNSLIPAALSGMATSIYGNPNSFYPQPYAGAPYQIGLINRGQILPQDLLLSTTNQALIEFFVSTPQNPIILTGQKWQSMQSLSSYNSFAEVDYSATSFIGGEVVYSFFVSPGNNLQDKDLSNFFPLFNTIRGNNPDILTLAVTSYSTGGGSNGNVNIGANIISQEAMS